MATKIRLRRGLASEWTNNDPILGLGEVGLEVDTKNFKVGDGLTSWSSLEYYITSTDNYYLKTEVDSLLNSKADLVDFQNLNLKLDEIFTDTNEPTGHRDRTESVMAFDESTRTLSIAPVGESFTVYVTGNKIDVSTEISVQIPNVSGNYFFYIDENGDLSYQTSFSVSLLNTKAYTAFVHYNANTGKAVSFGEERHGIQMDGSTHGYLHTTRGTQLVSGASVGYALDTSASISLSDMVVNDEDIRVSISHSSSPSSNHSQVLSPTAYIPVYYIEGNGWTKDIATEYPLKQGTVRPQFNTFSTSWSTQDTSADGKYIVSYIFATTNFDEPVIALMGQAEYNDLADAQANGVWSKISFGDLPAQEMKLLYTLFFETSSSYAAPKAVLKHVSDLRFGADREVSAYASNTSHSNLSGLANDDHLQYHNDLRGDARYYTKVESDSLLSAKANSLDVYSKGAVDSLLSTKANSIDVYTKTESDSLLSNKVDKITPITSGTYRRPVFTVNEQGQITSIREKLNTFIEDVTNASNNTTTFSTYLSLNITVSEVADYRIDFVAIYSNSTTNVSPIINVLLNGTGIYTPEYASREEPSDSSGVERSLRSGFVVKNLSIGSHTIELVFASEGSSTVTMRYGSLRVSEE